MASPLIYDPCALTDDEPIERCSWLEEDAATDGLSRSRSDIDFAPVERRSWLEEDAAIEGLSVSRSDIEFANIAKDVVAIEVRIANQSMRPSAPTQMVLQAAPLGAFVPWQPLAKLQVPALEPGQVTTVRSRARVRQPRPLGDPARIPPKKLLTALGLGDKPPRRSRRKRRSAGAPPGMGDLPADPMQLMLRGSCHWMGNLNVLVGKVDVERHLGRAVRVLPGRVNAAMFVVGSGGRDAYAFSLNDQGRDWNARLYDTTSEKALALNIAETPALAPEQWIASAGMCIVTLCLQPPRDCEAGTVEVHVTQRSTGRKAVVEFSLDPNAAGPGCYVV